MEKILSLVRRCVEDYDMIQPGDRVAQLMVVPVIREQIEVVEELPPTRRGSGGFGSTGR